MNSKYTLRSVILELCLVVLALVYLTPFYFVLVNAVKPFREILSNTAALPSAWQWGNFARAWEALRFPTALWNSLTVTILGNIGIILFSSMAAYWFIHHKGKVSRTVFYSIVFAMIIPFQTIMLPLLQVSNWIGVSNTKFGVVISYWGLGVSMATFLFYNFMKSLPIELEEATLVDGCGPIRRFWTIIFPLVRSIVVTILILDTLWIWNDYLLPSLFLGSGDLRTIPIAASMLFSQYVKQWDLGLAALVLSCTPIVIFFFALQKYVIQGVTAGSVKG